MAALAEVVYWPPEDVERMSGFYTFPASPLEYFSPSLAESICAHWTSGKRSPDWISGVRAAYAAAPQLLRDESRYLTGALEDLDLLCVLAEQLHRERVK